MVPSISKKKFQEIIWDYYKKEGRVLPWRQTRNAYYILVSEVMLQQTQVDRVIPKYKAFLATFPTVNTLAKASQIEILRLWQGLGYNRRALALRRLAEEVVAQYGGRLPRSIEKLEKLSGIGPYTAGAVAVFSWNKSHPLIETNIRNVYTHFFFEGMGQIEDREILVLVEKTLPLENPREWYYALMDYGAMLKKTHRDLNSKSKHYARQSKFEGSNRQIRGGILKMLLAGEATQSVLCSVLDIEEERGKRILAGLETEGFLKRNENVYFLS